MEFSHFRSEPYSRFVWANSVKVIPPLLILDGPIIIDSRFRSHASLYVVWSHINHREGWPRLAQDSDSAGNPSESSPRANRGESGITIPEYLSTVDMTVSGSPDVPPPGMLTSVSDSGALRRALGSYLYDFWRGVFGRSGRRRWQRAVRRRLRCDSLSRDSPLQWSGPPEAGHITGSAWSRLLVGDKW